MTDLNRFITGQLVPFTGENIAKSRFELCAFPITNTGEIQAVFFERLRAAYPRNNQQWKADALQPIFSDILLQQDQMQFRFRTRVVLTALINLHRKMKFWSSAVMLADTVDRSFCYEFRRFFNPVVWREMGFDYLNIDGRLKDQRFVNTVQEYLEKTGLEYSKIRFMRWDAEVQPIATLQWTYTGRKAYSANGNKSFFVPSAKLQMPASDIPQIPAGYWNHVAVCRKPTKNTPLDKW